MSEATAKKEQLASRNEFRGFTEFGSYSEHDREKMVNIFIAARKMKPISFSKKELPRDKDALSYLINELTIEHRRRAIVRTLENGTVVIEKRVRKKPS